MLQHRVKMAVNFLKLAQLYYRAIDFVIAIDLPQSASPLLPIGIAPNHNMMIRRVTAKNNKVRGPNKRI